MRHRQITQPFDQRYNKHNNLKLTVIIYMKKNKWVWCVYIITVYCYLLFKEEIVKQRYGKRKLEYNKLEANWDNFGGFSQFTKINPYICVLTVQISWQKRLLIVINTYNNPGLAFSDRKLSSSYVPAERQKPESSKTRYNIIWLEICWFQSIESLSHKLWLIW